MLTGLQTVSPSIWDDFVVNIRYFYNMKPDTAKVTMNRGKAEVQIRHGKPNWTVPELLFDKEQFIPALQQLLISYLDVQT